MKKELLIGIVIGAGVVALFTGANASSLLFGLVVLACPLMMIFMMGRHDHGQETDAPNRDKEEPSQ